MTRRDDVTFWGPVSKSYDRIASAACLQARLRRRVALLNGVAAQVAGGLVRLGVAALDEELIANDLVLIRSVLVAVGSGLVAVGGRLVAVSSRLIEIGQRLIGNSDRWIFGLSVGLGHEAPPGGRTSS